MQIKAKIYYEHIQSASQLNELYTYLLLWENFLISTMFVNHNGYFYRIFRCKIYSQSIIYYKEPLTDFYRSMAIISRDCVSFICTCPHANCLNEAIHTFLSNLHIVAEICSNRYVYNCIVWMESISDETLSDIFSRFNIDSGKVSQGEAF